VNKYRVGMCNGLMWFRTGAIRRLLPTYIRPTS